jgi:hypothetical protein
MLHVVTSRLYIVNLGRVSYHVHIHKQHSHSTEGVQDGVKVSPAPVARGGETVVPTYSIKITTSIMVKFSLVMDLWVA